ncbi:RDD family protein [Streptomyces sp. NPDC052301]|uniref:RDD family protein n=1 Tax=Streptomyces sp. NPDC052301 TaxID=3365687 RepID=UPI0037D18D81
MSAPTPAPGDDRPREGYYPDPSIPGYVRYWNGASWVPGTSRPAPQDGEPLTPPPGVRPAAPAVEETGPHFFDEDPRSPAWGADGQGSAGHAGTGGPQPGGSGAGDADGRAAWGTDPRLPADGPAGPAGHAHRADGTAPVPPADDDTPDPGGTFIFRRPVPGPAAVRDEGTMTFRPVPGQGRPGPRTPAGGPGTPGADGNAGHAPGGADFGPQASGQGAGGGAGFGAHDPGRAGLGSPGADPAGGPGSGAPVPTQHQAAGGHPGAGPAQGAGGSGGAQGAHPGDPGLGAPGVQGPVGAPSAAAGSPAHSTAPAGPGFSAGKAAAERAAAQASQAHAAQPPQTPHAPDTSGPQTPHAAQPPAAAPSVPQQAGPQQVRPAAAPATPLTAGPGGGQASWAQQVHQLAGGAEEQPVAPWKPPVEDVFQAAARRRAAARPAGLGKRFAARLIDSLVLGAVTAVAAVPLGIKAVDHVQQKIDAAKLSGREVTVWLLDGTTGTSLGIVLAVLLLGGVLYEVLPTVKWGRTLGKKLCGLQVRDIEAHEPPTFGPALRRWLVYSVPGLLGIGILGVLWCLFDRPWHQCWHDKAAHTFVAD